MGMGAKKGIIDTFDFIMGSTSATAKLAILGIEVGLIVIGFAAGKLL